MYLNCSS